MFNKFKRTAVIAAAGLAVLGVTACDPSTVEGKPVPTTERTVSPVKWTAPTTTMPVRLDPYSSSGKWLVPSEIKPGTYKATGQRRDGSGYWAVCQTLECDPGEGMIGNHSFDNVDYVVVPDHAVAVELRSAVLTPMEG